MKAARLALLTRLALFASLPALSLTACSRAGGALESVRDSLGALREDARAKSGAAAGGPAPAPVTKEAAAGEAAATAAPAQPQEAARKPAPIERKRVYSGFAKLSVDAIAEGRERLAALAEQWGGYIETIQGDTVVMRVPAERFREAFAAALEIGRVLEKRVETYDVTEQFQDLSGRLDIARRTRDRLYALLERTQDVKERVKILQEIRRLAEEVERLALTLDTIERQVAFSRITARLEGRLGEEQRARSGIPFPWIASLDPLYASLGRLKASVRLDLGADFAVFSGEKGYRAESAEGTRVRVATTANRPRGDARFWQEALAHALSPLYRSVERVELGPAAGVMLTSKDREHFGYLVAVVPRGRRLHVIEVFYPDPAARERRAPSVESALRGLEVR